LALYCFWNRNLLAGKSIEAPNKWPFGEVTYDQMHKQLEGDDKEFYTRNGMLNMLDRNRGIKLKYVLPMSACKSGVSRSFVSQFCSLFSR
jgi:hypothetical protein